MDGRQFDGLVRGAARAVSTRRGLALGLAAAAVALVVGADDAAASKRRQRGRRNRRRNVRICFKGRELVLNRVAARELVSRGARPGRCQTSEPGAEICPAGTVPCSLPPSYGSNPACCGPNSVCVTCNPGGACICCPAVGGSCPSCQADSFVCCSPSGSCSCCAADQGCDADTGSCTGEGSPEDE